MAGNIESPPVLSGGFTDVMRWALTGTKAEPSIATQNQGWLPQSIAPPPDYRLENFRDFQLYVWMLRLQAAAFFAERSIATYSVPAAPVAGLTHILTLDGHVSGTYTVPIGATQAIVAAGICAMLTADPTLGLLGIYSPSGVNINITWTDPGHVFTYAHGGTGPALTATLAPTTPIVRQPFGYGLDFVLGSPTLNYDGSHASRMFYHSARGAFRAGYAASANWDLANLGFRSVAFGDDSLASGDNSLAIGQGEAVGDHGVAFGHGKANGWHSQASGTGQADGDYSKAAGYGSLAPTQGENAFAAAQPDVACLVQKGNLHLVAKLVGVGSILVTPDGLGVTTWNPLDNSAYQCELAITSKLSGGFYNSWKVWFSFMKIAGVITIHEIIMIKGATVAFTTVAVATNLDKYHDAGIAQEMQIDSAAGKIKLTAITAAAETSIISADLQYVVSKIT